MKNERTGYQRKIVKETLFSSYLREERDLIIYLPPGYQETATYPVIYCQDGEQFFNFGRIATQATELILEQNMQPPIIVGVEVNAPLRNDDYHPLGDRHPYYCQFFIEEMLPFIEDLYPVRTKAQDRILAGDSLGATVSLHIALNEPKLFTNLISLSGAFYEATQQRIAQCEDLSWLHTYMLIGLQETDVKTDHGSYNFLELNRMTKQLMEQKNAHLHYIEKDGTHLWRFWQQELPDALMYFLSSP